MSSFMIPTPSAPAEEWGRIAVSLPGWKWMPGMYAVASSGSTRVASVIPRWWLQAHAAVPNPDDPATAGCLLYLLGDEAWRVRAAHAQHRQRPWQVDDGAGISWHTTLGRACIAAAEALGRWPGGEG